MIRLALLLAAVAYAQRHAADRGSAGGGVVASAMGRRMDDVNPRTPPDGADLARLMTMVLSARDQIAADRRCDKREECRSLSSRTKCECFKSAAIRVHREEKDGRA